MTRILPFFMLMACSSGDWVVTTWGEDFIEDEIPSGEFSDGCAVRYDTFSVNISEAALLDGDDEIAGEVEAGVFDVTEPGPQTVGVASVPAAHYDTARFVISPDIHVVGTLTCGADSVTFDWSFDTETTYLCEPADLTVPSGGEATTDLTIHGDHLFYDSLESADAGLQGQPILEADADKDGAVTLAELSAVSVASIGHDVGQYSEVTDLGAFITHLSRTLGHVDGEGHCQVNL